MNNSPTTEGELEVQKQLVAQYKQNIKQYEVHQDMLFKAFGKAGEEGVADTYINREEKEKDQLILRKQYMRVSEALFDLCKASLPN